ncbi:4-(cytidine 5'-diphospho)-2-C-methyl-D-erythritol kinase [Macrococcus armenti]|uniref:4-(cytidine 5'-diphospho)-2-C-methyl-D-erythritol kinase n=1 Tax=Macrococcus armenti TaxID=2875764 RepID=UPI001CD03446|nr:4-(cytidine 5'-diphospho)-2-C-methyl-D-erythritol kinase [Macrococcus armenti]UBH08555.1 4-(cytidine 5'-diphospho)-2-C-methyl-D-erythritol kinase [Macrococcus armenti]UBH10840.1 4-(cytidine 5'-diphospho)-2-C-methyl-D-erythritol kinase [Macrococcus armenti]UBH15321.1 4-(cytidine 5'-diphospho)-2-C-methyl-D-erythritol kinase [Macrococcus armenti]UBH17679.1 4-(cytidine 5'-diphospho)-2-C-methyl-D-erythritol kinase [Macrococcus armenti]UBH19946.1 4-(cytidine 5'-diphospho)-2-C-methyl-D-erythritol 
MIYENAPAKINLTLDTLFKRSDGYHEVEMIMTTVDLYDRLTLEKRKDKRIVLKIEHRYVPNDHRNLAYKAAQLMMERYDIKQGVTITLDKTIPIAAGLAGGSSDAAATFRGMNRLFNLGLSLDTLAELSSEIGSDIPFCVHGKTTLCKGRGEILEHLPKPPACWVVLAKPEISVSTQEVYGALDLTAPHDVIDNASCKAAIESGDYQEMIQSLGNRLEPVTIEMHPVIQMLKDTMMKAGADAAMMSGSGPTVYGLAAKERQAKGIVNALKGCCKEVYMVRMLG